MTAYLALIVSYILRFFQIMLTVCQVKYDNIVLRGGVIDAGEQKQLTVLKRVFH